MKLHIPKYDLNNWGPPPTIFYKTDPNIRKTPADNLESPKVNIKTQTGIGITRRS